MKCAPWAVVYLSLRSLEPAIKVRLQHSSISVFTFPLSHSRASSHIIAAFQRTRIMQTNAEIKGSKRNTLGDSFDPTSACRDMHGSFYLLTQFSGLHRFLLPWTPRGEDAWTVSRRETKHQHKLETFRFGSSTRATESSAVGVGKNQLTSPENFIFKAPHCMMLGTFSPSSPTKSIFEICQCWLKKKTFRLLNLAAVRDAWTSCSACRKFFIVPSTMSHMWESLMEEGRGSFQILRN